MPIRVFTPACVQLRSLSLGGHTSSDVPAGKHPAIESLTERAQLRLRIIGVQAKAQAVAAARKVEAARAAVRSLHERAGWAVRTLAGFARASLQVQLLSSLHRKL